MNDAAKCGYGLASWSLAEYWLHRELGHHLHTMLRTQHLEHHRDPEAGSSSKWAAVACALLITGDPFLMGLVAGYFGYEWIHYRAHHSGTENRHLAHHGQPDVNYGVTTHWWDRCFGTYQ